ncbi:MAG: transposase, partial [Candidatus Hodarchaeota archaeon]
EKVKNEKLVVIHNGIDIHRFNKMSDVRKKTGTQCASGGQVDRLDQMIFACFVLGISTCKVAKVLLPVLGEPVSATTVSRVAKSLDQAVSSLVSHGEELLLFHQIKDYSLWPQIRTTNAIERRFREVRKHTRPWESSQTAPVWNEYCTKCLATKT